MKRYLFCLIFLCYTSFGFAQNNSSIDFVIKNLGINVDGHFNTFSIITDFNSDGVLTNVTGIIEASSLRTGIESRDEHLLEEDYFNTDKHKYISLHSNELNKKSDNRYALKAELSIKGITKEISIDVYVSKTGDGYKITSSFEINRKDYKVGGSSFVMSKNVKINIIHYHKL